MLRNCAALAGLGCDTPTRCTKVSAPGRCIAVSGGIQRVARDAFAAGRQAVFGAAPYQAAHLVAAPQQLRGEALSHESAGAGR